MAILMRHFCIGLLDLIRQNVQGYDRASEVTVEMPLDALHFSLKNPIDTAFRS